MPAANVTLYAVWVGIPVSLLYDGNQSDGGSAPTDQTGLQPNTAAAVVTGPGSLTLSGCYFVGWALSPTGRAMYGAAPLQNTIQMGISDVTLYATWHCDNSPSPVPTPRNTVPLTVTVSGGGSVVASFAQAIVTSTSSTNYYNLNVKETLTAYPMAGYRATWSGACSVSSNKCTVTMSQARQVVVTFIPDIRLPVFFFDTDKWAINQSSSDKAQLMTSLALLSQYGIKKLYLYGYADVRSSSAHNLFLGTQRANAVAQYLTSLLKQMRLPPMSFVQISMGQTAAFGYQQYATNRRTIVDF
jgi:outer membrane protein OmpA-like peptidoglycan-associated protein